jgi:hypothetical protein
MVFLSMWLSFSVEFACILYKNIKKYLDFFNRSD